MPSDPTSASEPPSRPTENDSAEICPACRHSTASHDVAGIRFCAATVLRHLERPCICAGEQQAGPYYVPYRLTNKR